MRRGGGAGLGSHSSATNNHTTGGGGAAGLNRAQQQATANNSGNQQQQSRRRGGPSFQNRGAAIMGGLPLHQASMIAQESRLMNHQDDDMTNSIYSGSYGGGGGRTPIGATSVNGIGLAPITRTNTVSLHNNQHHASLGQNQHRANQQNPYAPAGVLQQQNNIFMNDSAPSLFHHQVAGRSNTFIPNTSNQRNGQINAASLGSSTAVGYNQVHRVASGGDALDNFMNQQPYNVLSNTQYGLGQGDPVGGLFGGAGINLAPSYIRPHQYTATHGGFNRGGLNANNNSLSLAGAAILGGAAQQPNPIVARRITTVSDFERDFLGNTSSQGALPGFGNPSVGASRVRDEEHDGAFSQNDQNSAFPPRFQMDSRLNHQHEDDEDINQRDEDGFADLPGRRDRTESETERHLGHFQHLSESNRNFVESLVDDILARNHQINQLHMAYSLASQRSQNAAAAGSNSGISINNQSAQRDTEAGEAHPTSSEINQIIDSQLEVLRQQQNLLGINPQNINQGSRQGSHIKASSHSSEEDYDDDDEDESLSSGNSSRERDQDNQRHEEEGLNHNGYYDEEELDIDRLREQIFEGATASHTHPYRELFRHGTNNSGSEAQNPYRLQPVTSSSSNQRRGRRHIYGEEDDEENDNPYGAEDDEEEEEVDRLGTAAQLMILREHHRRQLEEIAAGIHDDDEDDEEAARDRANIIQEQDQQLEEDEEDIQDDEEEHEEDMMDGEEALLAAGNVGRALRSGQNEQLDDDECGDAGLDGGDEGDESELERYLRDISQGKHAQRAKTAPIKAAKQADQFKLTPGFTYLEQAAVCAVQLVQRGDLKFDLDSFEGQNSCKKFLTHVEKLCESVEAKCQNRQYRKKFSNAYKVLYKEGKLCYLTEILDSAQEAFPYLWVNGEKYVFSKEVIEAGRNLFNNFCKILYQVKDAYQRVCEENTYDGLVEVMQEMREALEDFDMNWVTYEQLYVIELMLIEQDARRYITEAIEVEKEITSAEVRERAKGKIMVDCPEYKKNRARLIVIFNKINAVANPEGKGRDDLQAEILFSAESLCRKISSSQSKAVRKLAEAIKKSFMGIRILLRKYEENIEGVDPQLKNNADLVTALVEFEQSWEKGKTYFVNEKKCAQLLHFTQIIEGTSEKYKGFSEQIEDRDTVIFVTIPALLILKNLDDGDDKGICRTFFPPMFGPQVSGEESDNGTAQNLSKEEKDQASKKYQDLREHYTKLRSRAKNAYDYYNFIEKCVLEMENDDKSKANTEEVMMEQMGLGKDDLQKLVQQIRILSMQLQRHKPVEWNEFLDVAL